jgi:hypothetical protein
MAKTTIFKPEIPEYLKQVIGLFVGAIPPDAREKCVLEDQTRFSTAKNSVEKQAFLLKFAQQQLDRISRFEYANWLNGRMPFISPREIQLWRLRQFAEFIWDWNLPDDDDLATIFNLTKRQATNLVGDFHAKFRKLYLYPRILQRLFNLLAQKETRKDVRIGDSVGRLYLIPSKRYVNELNTVIGELREREPRRIIRNAVVYERNDQLMWVSEEVISLMNDQHVKEELSKLHPIGGEGLE